MGKRSDFKRIPRDFYPTPLAAVVPLTGHIGEDVAYWEPCAGERDLIEHISDICPQSFCVGAMDIQSPDADRFDNWHNMLEVGDALQSSAPPEADYIITNPPWDRKILHPMIEHFSAMRPTWLLFDADWMHTKQSAPFMPYLRKIVSVGRVKWIPDSKMTGKDNCAWYLFDQNGQGSTQFYGRTS
jgi:hypothetical protein